MQWEAAYGISRSCMIMPSSNHLKYLTERTSVLLFTYDLLGSQFTFMNQACITFFDLSSKEIKPLQLIEMVSADDQMYILSKLKAFLSGEIVENVEFRVKRGAYERWLQVTPFLITDGGTRLLAGEAKDITAYKETIEVLNNHNIKKNSILTILAHDLAGPIGTVQNLSILLSRETALFSNEKIDRLISLISKINNSNIHLIRNFLDREFLESAETVLFKKRVDLVTKLNTATEEILKVQEELMIQFIVTSNQPSIYAEVDEDKFMQVINNLITNALKFTPDGGKIEINITDKITSVLISVSDSGVGIPQKYHATLFNKFTDASRPGLKGEVSNGLGMFIIKTIVEWHEGKIWFESEENAGTTFYIRLPVHII